MRRLPPLSSLRAFEAAARHGSFKLAAAKLAVTPTAISHQIRFLEEYTGLNLFERQVRKVVLTEAGARLYPILRDGFNAFEAGLHQLTAAAPRRQVMISATNAFMAYWLAPRIADFNRLYPDIDIDLHASDQPVELGAGQADLAVRYGRGPYPGMQASGLFSDHFVPMASPALGNADPADRRVALISFRWMREDAMNPTWPVWFEAAKLPWVARPGHMRFSDEGHAIQAALSGQGIALLSQELLADELRAGRLVRLPGPALPGHTYHVVSSAGHTLEPHVAAARDWLRAQGSDHVSDRRRTPGSGNAPMR